MLRHSFHPLVLTIFVLALLGIGSALYENPGAFITRILVTVGLLAILIFVFRTFIMPRLMQSQSRMSYAQKQSSFTQKTNGMKKPVSTMKNKKSEKKRISRPLVKRQSNVKLTVIEGKKNKKKNRALF
ncbi:hypothetical protein SAMN05421736_102265 [Evansella caseinilytica]|uniref:Uncharacterized protein n=1 Tax=Evansella caseinilytica TaxID=1503961 RepID=A0A1H3KVV9_9BACI|nr:SA1362 family protein [Evansella caseinilytica]SDY55868.1 hypothetical protein SAMN05421736_102265 [Evansella caseinilytica]